MFSRCDTKYPSLVCKQLNYSDNVDIRVRLWGTVFPFLYSAWTHSYPNRTYTHYKLGSHFTLIGCTTIISNYLLHDGSGWLSRHSDWLRAGRFGDRIPVGASFFAPAQTGPGAHPASYTIGAVSFPRVKRPERGAQHPPPCSAEVKKTRIASTVLPYWTFVACYRVTFTIFICFTIFKNVLWFCGLRRRSVATRFLGSRVRILLRTWKLVSCVFCVLCG